MKRCASSGVTCHFKAKLIKVLHDNDVAVEHFTLREITQKTDRIREIIFMPTDGGGQVLLVKLEQQMTVLAQLDLVVLVKAVGNANCVETRSSSIEGSWQGEASFSSSHFFMRKEYLVRGNLGDGLTFLERADFHLAFHRHDEGTKG